MAQQKKQNNASDKRLNVTDRPTGHCETVAQAAGIAIWLGIDDNLISQPIIYIIKNDRI